MVLCILGLFFRIRQQHSQRAFCASRTAASGGGNSLGRFHQFQISIETRAKHSKLDGRQLGLYRFSLQGLAPRK